MAAPNDTELKIISKFRENLKDLNLQGFRNTDLGLVQWLRARDLNLEKAEEMLRKSLKWREDQNVDSILSWTHPVIFDTLCPIEIDGFDKENCPVAYIPFGRWDIRQLFNLGHRDAVIRYGTFLFEKLIHETQGKLLSSGLPVTQYVHVVNVEGLSVGTLACYGAIEMALEIFKIMEANYPETLKRSIIVNGSKVFTLFFNLLKPLISKSTMGKVTVYDKNVENWRPALLEAIELDQLPKSLVATW